MRAFSFSGAFLHSVAVPAHFIIRVVFICVTSVGLAACGKIDPGTAKSDQEFAQRLIDSIQQGDEEFLSNLEHPSSNPLIGLRFYGLSREMVKLKYSSLSYSLLPTEPASPDATWNGRSVKLLSVPDGAVKIEGKFANPVSNSMPDGTAEWTIPFVKTGGRYYLPAVDFSE